MWVLELCLLTSLLAFKRSHQLELKVSYQLVEDFGQDAEEMFNERHNIVRRDAGVGNSNESSIQPSISGPKGSVMPSKSASGITHQTATVQDKTTSSPYISVTSVSPSTPRPSVVMTTSVPTSKVSTTNVPNNVTMPTTLTGTMPTTLTGTTEQANVTSKSPSTSSGTTMAPTTRMGRTTSNVSTVEDNHKYYRSRFYSPVSGANLWFDLTDGGTPKLHTNLSLNLQYSDRINTTFKFPYYGHIIDYVTITNRGYVFLGEVVHRFNASAQYAAPLMADFGPDLHTKTAIQYVDTGERFTVQWSNMKLRNQKAGEFTFQFSIFKNGTIIFGYKKIPISLTEIFDNNNIVVRVGLSDTYRFDSYVKGPITIGGKQYSGIHFITYYLYHKVNLPKKLITNDSAFVIIPEPNCVSLDLCASCVNGTAAFSCTWCPKIKRCSDGIDRHRQKWLMAGCLTDSTKTCPKPRPLHRKGSINGGEIFLIVFILVLILAVICWLFYGYRHPESKLGMCLIEYGNPRKWCRKSDHEQNESPRASYGGRISFKTMSFESNA